MIFEIGNAALPTSKPYDSVVAVKLKLSVSVRSLTSGHTLHPQLARM